MKGPKASVPETGAGPTEDLPYAQEPRSPSRDRWWILAAIVAVLAIAGGMAALGSRDSGSDASAPQARSGGGAQPGPSGSADRPAATKAATSTTRSPATTRAPATTRPPRTTTPPPAVTTTTRPPAPKVPVADLPPHEAVYRDGKLYLQGTLPNRKLADLFRRKAVEVIGADNVVVRYQFDSRVPTPTDGHVRVDERFVFDKGSAKVDPAYLKVFDLGVAVLSLNPQATMRIRGYTDDTGSPALNKALSERRAGAAADYLVEHGIDRSRLTVIGFGPGDPVVPNDSDEHRAENRRIEVDLYHLLG